MDQHHCSCDQIKLFRGIWNHQSVALVPDSLVELFAKPDHFLVVWQDYDSEALEEESLSDALLRAHAFIYNRQADEVDHWEVLTKGVRARSPNPDAITKDVAETLLRLQFESTGLRFVVPDSFGLFEDKKELLIDDNNEGKEYFVLRWVTGQNGGKVVCDYLSLHSGLFISYCRRLYQQFNEELKQNSAQEDVCVDRVSLIAQSSGDLKGRLQSETVATTGEVPEPEMAAPEPLTDSPLSSDTSHVEKLLKSLRLNIRVPNVSELHERSAEQREEKEVTESPVANNKGEEPVKAVPKPIPEKVNISGERDPLRMLEGGQSPKAFGKKSPLMLIGFVTLSLVCVVVLSVYFFQSYKDSISAMVASLTSGAVGTQEKSKAVEKPAGKKGQASASLPSKAAGTPPQQEEGHVSYTEAPSVPSSGIAQVEKGASVMRQSQASASQKAPPQAPASASGVLPSSVAQIEAKQEVVAKIEATSVPRQLPAVPEVSDAQALEACARVTCGGAGETLVFYQGMPRCRAEGVLPRVGEMLCPAKSLPVMSREDLAQCAMETCAHSRDVLVIVDGVPRCRPENKKPSAKEKVCPAK